MKVLIIDNYDSFTYNLVQILRDMPAVEVLVRRNDAFEAAEIAEADALLLSPGPGVPTDAGQLMALLGEWAGRKPILGVCLGMQAIAEHYGGRLRNLEQVYHGKSSPVQVTDQADPIFAGLGDEFVAGRYHSWVAERGSLPASLRVSAETADGEIMALRHESEPVFGLQFHPESVLTPQGTQMVHNFIQLASTFNQTQSV